MSKPIIAAKHPKGVELEEGQEYYWCSCDRSKNQPFCDGSHRGTDFTPLAFKAKASEKAFLCMCKHSKNPPYCDGAHQSLPKEAVTPVAHVASAEEVQATPEEPTVKRIHDLAQYGLEQTGHHGEMVAMGVPRNTLPAWDDIQLLAAQFATKPLMEDVPVGSDLIIGPNANKPLVLKPPLFVSDMSFGSLSPEAKLALAQGAQLAGTGICSGEGGMMREEQAAN
ncbi:MAG: CDGSH iron-sulfur domain-containing protein, partial [Mariprofundaceae bacterium]|nr:CDGSH iron-sulfur domain-containing protein [Mariprofundaceae bacterium]